MANRSMHHALSPNASIQNSMKTNNATMTTNKKQEEGDADTLIGSASSQPEPAPSVRSVMRMQSEHTVRMANVKSSSKAMQEEQLSTTQERKTSGIIPPLPSSTAKMNGMREKARSLKRPLRLLRRPMLKQTDQQPRHRQRPDEIPQQQHRHTVRSTSPSARSKSTSRSSDERQSRHRSTSMVVLYNNSSSEVDTGTGDEEETDLDSDIESNRDHRSRRIRSSSSGTNESSGGMVSGFAKGVVVLELGFMILNSNLYWSVWVALGLEVWIWTRLFVVSWSPGRDGSGTSSSQSRRYDVKKQVRLHSLFLQQIFSSFLVLYFSYSFQNGIFCSGLIGTTKLCRSATVGVAIGVLLILCSAVHFCIARASQLSLSRRSSHRASSSLRIVNDTTSNIVLSTLSFLFNIINVSLTTSPGGAASENYNLFVSSWVCLVVSYFMVLSCLECWLVRGIHASDVEHIKAPPATSTIGTMEDADGADDSSIEEELQALGYDTTIPAAEVAQLPPVERRTHKLANMIRQGQGGNFSSSNPSKKKDPEAFEIHSIDSSKFADTKMVHQAVRDVLKEVGAPASPLLSDPPSSCAMTQDSSKMVAQLLRRASEDYSVISRLSSGSSVASLKRTSSAPVASSSSKRNAIPPIRQSSSHDYNGSRARRNTARPLRRRTVEDNDIGPTVSERIALANRRSSTLSQPDDNMMSNSDEYVTLVERLETNSLSDPVSYHDSEKRSVRSAPKIPQRSAQSSPCNAESGDEDKLSPVDEGNDPRPTPPVVAKLPVHSYIQENLPASPTNLTAAFARRQHSHHFSREGFSAESPGNKRHQSAATMSSISSDSLSSRKRSSRSASRPRPSKENQQKAQSSNKPAPAVDTYEQELMDHLRSSLLSKDATACSAQTESCVTEEDINEVFYTGHPVELSPCNTESPPSSPGKCSPTVLSVIGGDEDRIIASRLDDEKNTEVIAFPLSTRSLTRRKQKSFNSEYSDGNHVDAEDVLFSC
ncbi:predicted protein [Thalassiosira pseudonana CCMP1335]|uniref:Uncharacterized protein n=1 Tax=Thalassiosira pseudonana TaxID=35128 RepID=B8LDG2_THAPS|nr:predicted protein [Thalassiosira pseudonana CCMP1335]EED86704.1 predicted protein [Thalassiosira pseudonana CCMP1335]